MKKYVIFLLLGIVVGFTIHNFWPERGVSAKLVIVNSRNLSFSALTTARTLGEFAIEQNINPDSLVYENGESAVIHGMTVKVRPELWVEVIDGERRGEYLTRAETIGDLILEQGIALAETDQVTPGMDVFLTPKTQVRIDRIVDLEVMEQAQIPYQTKLIHTSARLYGQEEVVQTGRAGQKEQFFLITYRNGAEVGRRLLGEQVLREPIDQIKEVGTRVEIVEAEEGRASWYHFMNCMCAAHPRYPRGSFVRVTALSNGKSIIVRINDHGPNQAIHPDRVIDLDSVAFSELASLGTGTIAVKAELIR